MYIFKYQISIKDTHMYVCIQTHTCIHTPVKKQRWSEMPKNSKKKRKKKGSVPSPEPTAPPPESRAARARQRNTGVSGGASLAPDRWQGPRPLAPRPARAPERMTLSY